MKLLGNILWLVFGGLETAVEYFMAGIAMMLTIVGIPFGIASMRIGLYVLWPFGSHVVDKPHSSGCLSLPLNIIWIFIAGFWICLTHLFFGVLLCITIVGIPFGKKQFELAGLALAPFGKTIV